MNKRNSLLLFVLSCFVTKAFCSVDNITIINKLSTFKGYQSVVLQAVNNAKKVTAPYQQDAWTAKQKFHSLLYQASANNTMKGLKSSILVFVSFSMPDQSLVNILRDAQKIHASVVIRGLIDNSFSKTFSRVTQLVKQGGGGGVELNPLWFKRFQITQVPTVIVLQQPLSCSPPQDCSLTLSDHFDKISGNISLIAALKEIAHRGEYGHEVSEKSLTKLETYQNA